MPLDPEIAALLAALKSMPALERLSPNESRAIVAAMGMSAPPGPALLSVESEYITTAAGAVPVRIYRSSDQPRGLIVYYHAGGWVLGDLDSSDAFLRRLALQTECSIVSVEYRLAPEHPFPAAVLDANAALSWASGASTTLAGGDVPLLVAGESAGGNLAAVVAILAKQSGGPALAGQVLLCPVTDANFDTPSYRDNAEGFFLTRGLMQWFWNHYAPSPEQRGDFRASPLRCSDLSGLPPTLVQTAEYDPLRAEGEAYANKLAQAGVTVTLQRRAGLIHGYSGMHEVSAAARDAIADAAAWIKQLLRSSPARS